MELTFVNLVLFYLIKYCTTKKNDALIGEYNRNDASSVVNFFEREPQPVKTPERDFALWVMAAKVPFYQLSKVLPLFSNFFCCP